MRSVRAGLLLLAALSWCICSCADLLAPGQTRDRNLQDFEAAWEIAATHYPFFAFKRVNWDSMYTAFRPRAAQARGDDIYPLLCELFLPLRDVHIQVQSEAGYPMVNYRWPRVGDVATYSPTVVRHYCRYPLRVTGENNMEYGLVGDTIGYLHFATFARGEWIRAVDQALAELSHTHGLIVDVRNNFGGSSTSSDYVLARFIDRPLTQVMYFRDGRTVSWTIEPCATLRYAGRVVVLINGATLSAAEMFAELMRQMPTVTVLGDTSGGGGGDTELFGLPSGKKLKLPVKFARRTDGEMIEWNGIIPDVVVEQTASDVRKGTDKQLAAAIALLQATPPR